MRSIFIEYFKIRIDPIKMVALTMLMSLLVLKTEDSTLEWVFSIVFLGISFIVFRVLDDCFSVELDRKDHPKRTYLNSSNFNGFKKLTVYTLLIYVMALGFFCSEVVWLILFLISGSLILYGLFYQQRFVMKVIPLLKYPVLLYSLSILNSSEMQIEVYGASLFLIAGFDGFDIVKSHPNQIWKPLVLWFICGVLLFKPWLNALHILTLVSPIFIIYIIRKKEIAPYFSMLYFPITYFTLNHL